MNTEELDPDILEQLPICLAKRRYFLLFEWTKSAVKILISNTRGKVQDCLMDQDENCFLSKLCWDIGLSSDNLELKHSLLKLSVQLLGPSDPAGLAARLASVPAGLMAVRRMEGKDCKLVMKQMEEELDRLEEQVTSWGMRRTVFSYKLQLCLVCNKEVYCLNLVVDKMARLGDLNGLETMSVIVTGLKKFSMDQVAVKALMEAQSLDKKLISKERRAVVMLEIMSRHPEWWKHRKVLEVVKGLNWSLGDMLGEAVKLVWNSWVVLKDKDSQESGWGKALVLLHNLATEVIDHITCKLDQPTITLLRRVRRVARGDMVGE